MYWGGVGEGGEGAGQQFWCCLGFRKEMIDPKNSNVVTQNISYKEEEYTEMITDAGLH